MKKLILILTLTAFLGCSKSDETKGYSLYIDSAVTFSVFNKQNKDLLNPNNPDHLNTSNIKIFYVVNGEKQEVSEPRMDYPKGFRLYKRDNEDKYRIVIFLNNTETAEKPITYIQWNDTDTDTIEATFRRGNFGILKKVLWLNGKKVWEVGDNNAGTYFELTK